MKSKCKIDKYGTKHWRNEQDKYHREDGPAVEFADGDKHWYINGKRHRIDGPAVEWAGYKEWWVNDKLHREDGPALEYINGAKYWYYHGELIKVSSQEEFERRLRLKLFW